MMAEQRNGMSLSGQNRQFMSVFPNKPNGKRILCLNFQIDIFNFLPNLLFLSPLRWYAKRFLHPDIVAPYEYIFMWDEDLGVENFNAEE